MAALPAGSVAQCCVARLNCSRNYDCTCRGLSQTKLLPRNHSRAQLQTAALARAVLASVLQTASLRFTNPCYASLAGFEVFRA